MNREWLERRILVPVLVVYIVLLALAAWRHEIRPSLFDEVCGFARSTLALVGIRPAVAVFSADTGSGPDAKIAAICLEVRSLSSASHGRRRYPAEGVSCPAHAPRWWVRGEEIFLQRSVVTLRAAVVASQSGKFDRSRMRFAKLLADSIGAHFARHDGAEYEVADTPDRTLLLWREARISYDTRARSERVVALFDWQSVPSPRVFISWRPDEARLRERGWETGQP